MYPNSDVDDDDDCSIREKIERKQITKRSEIFRFVITSNQIGFQSITNVDTDFEIITRYTIWVVSNNIDYDYHFCTDLIETFAFVDELIN